MPENNIANKVTVGVTTLLLVGAIGGLLLLWRTAHGESEHSRQIAIDLPQVLEPIKRDLQEIKVKQVEQRIILEHISRTIDELTLRRD